MARRSTVAVVRSSPERVLDDIKALGARAGLKSALKKGCATILKENISWHFPFPGANTTPWQLEGTILALREAGFADLVCVANDTVVTNAFKGERRNRLKGVFERYQIPVLYNFRREDIQWEVYEPRAELLVLHRVYPRGIRIPTFFHGRNIVHLPTMKTHIYTTTTGAMKNAFGGLLSTRRHYTHSVIHQTLVDLLAIQQEIHPGILATMDGTTAGNGPGPRTMEPVIKNVILASVDQVAIDAVAARLMGFEPLGIEYIRLAHERGLGVGDIAEIELVGDDMSGENWGFEVGYNFHRFLAWMAWYGPTRFLQKLVLRTPLVIIPTFMSEFNHDWVHWPLKERHVYEDWRANTSWGRLFARYQEEGFLSSTPLSEADGRAVVFG
jgi:uncharacterized protein (DUF362 family)